MYNRVAMYSATVAVKVTLNIPNMIPVIFHYDNDDLKQPAERELCTDNQPTVIDSKEDILLRKL
ncbi:hypothetical protein T06_7132 [Trichinella sp. T6]|nr:hypothetical protein T06_7132 [Trichinella sp. T6]